MSSHHSSHHHHHHHHRPPSDYDDDERYDPRYESRGSFDDRRGYDTPRSQYEADMRYQQPPPPRGPPPPDMGYRYQQPPPPMQPPPPNVGYRYQQPPPPLGPPPPNMGYRYQQPPPPPGPPPPMQYQQPRPPPCPPPQMQPPPLVGYPNGPPVRKKSLLIGINYVGSEHRLQGCHQDVENVRQFLSAMGYPTDQRSQVILRDDQYTDPRGPMFPNGHNILAAMAWLVSEPGTCNFLHYSGHGGQVPARSDYSASDQDDTIVPFDFERNGQIPSGVLHRSLVTCLPPNSTLHVLFDCCHSGSAIELPYVFTADGDGNISMMDNVQAGIRLFTGASHLMQGGFSFEDIMGTEEGQGLLSDAKGFFGGLMHNKQQETDQYGLGRVGGFEEEYHNEGPKSVWMYSGCRDDQTSADASIGGAHVGAMSWAFLECMKRFGTHQSYVQVLQNTRQILRGKYQQIPQLSVGFQQDLNYQMRL